VPIFDSLLPFVPADNDYMMNYDDERGWETSPYLLFLLVIFKFCGGGLTAD
jgi:hypothetical protein